MQKKLKVKLRNALKNAGLSEGLADKMSGWTDEEVESYIEALNSNDADDDDEVDFDEIISSDEFNEWAEKKGFDYLTKKSKSLQSGNDKKVGQALDTVRKKAFGGKKKGKDDDADDDDDTVDSTEGMPDWFKPFAKTIKVLATDKKTGSKLDEARKAMEASENLPPKIQKKWLGRIDLNSDVDFKDQVEALEEEYTELFGEYVPSDDDDDSGSSKNNYTVPSGKKKKKEDKLSPEEEKDIDEVAKSFSMNQ